MKKFMVLALTACLVSSPAMAQEKKTKQAFIDGGIVELALFYGFMTALTASVMATVKTITDDGLKCQKQFSPSTGKLVKKTCTSK